MSKGVLILVIVMVVLIICFGVFYLVTRPTYGNDLSGIQKAIEKNGGSGSAPTIIDRPDMAGNRYVGFMEDNGTLGVAIFFSDGRGNFVYENIHRQQGTTIAAFYEPFAVEVEGTHGVDIVVSKNPLLYRVERYVDGVFESEKIVDTPNSASVVAMEFHSLETALNVELKYFDEKGNQITP
ncbi:hypothetical protein LJC07_07075 [Christensenellaceae bacterium OttesenSCG-928-L17]|nr:hypothetical protein [Christensenellaceae bacterium OttesenSCG-928-L17]